MLITIFSIDKIPLDMHKKILLILISHKPKFNHNISN